MTSEVCNSTNEAGVDDEDFISMFCLMRFAFRGLSPSFFGGIIHLNLKGASNDEDGLLTGLDDDLIIS